MRTALAALLLALSASIHAQAEPSLDTVVARLHAYLRDYARHLPATIATERYEQRAGSGVRRQRRVLESEFGLVQVPGDTEWLGFREVRKVDGKPVLDSASRLADLIARPSTTAVQQARRIAEESARFNIGPVFRTINDPTIVLELLDPRHAPRMRFSRAGTADEGRTRIVRFLETARPTIIRTRSLDDQAGAGARVGGRRFGTNTPRRDDCPAGVGTENFHRNDRRALRP